MYDMSAEYDNDEGFMMDITADTEDRTVQTGGSRAVAWTETGDRRSNLTTVAIVMMAVAITMVVGIFIGTKIIAPPSDQYDYGKMSCWELLDEAHQQRKISENFRDPDVTEEARRRLANANDWFKEKDC